MSRRSRRKRPVPESARKRPTIWEAASFRPCPSPSSPQTPPRCHSHGPKGDQDGDTEATVVHAACGPRQPDKGVRIATHTVRRGIDTEVAVVRAARGRGHRDNDIRFFTIAEVAEHLSVATRTVRRWIEAGHLVAHR